jgi:hypothetical protein
MTSSGVEEAGHRTPAESEGGMSRRRRRARRYAIAAACSVAGAVPCLFSIPGEGRDVNVWAAALTVTLLSLAFVLAPAAFDATFRA